jgi:membrane fusion protein (multidrug efflux system)
MFSRVELEVERIEQAVVIPESAIANDSIGSYVWRVNPESLAERAAVELGTRRDGQVVIVTGLASGESIVTSGTHKVFEGGGVQSPDAVPVVSGTP